MRGAAAPWEKHYGDLLEIVGFKKGGRCGVVFFHVERDIALSVHGDDFTLCASEEDLMWIKSLIQSWLEVKVRAMLGPDPSDDKEVVILGRVVQWMETGISYQADPKHRQMLLEHFGFVENSRILSVNGDKDNE